MIQKIPRALTIAGSDSGGGSVIGPAKIAPLSTEGAAGATSSVASSTTVSDVALPGSFAGEGFAGWAAGTYMRLPEAIAQALNPPTPTPTPD